MKAGVWRVFLPGLILGFTVSRLGFTDYRELHRMLLFRDLRLFLAFAAALALSVLFFALLKGRLKLGPVRLHPGVVPGSIAFGVGWALTGACPGVVLAQVGQGILPALVSLAGVLAGSCAASRWVSAKRSPGGC